MTSNRVTFGHDIPVDYWNNKQPSKNVLPFKQHRDKYFPIIKDIRNIVKKHKCDYVWFFFEPYIEITWIVKNEKQSKLITDSIKKYLKSKKIKDYKFSGYLKDHNIGDWFCCSESEKEFGCKVHHLCAEFVESYFEHKQSVDNGKTLEKQVGRTIHRLCNPLGLNYFDEIRICFRRGMLCLIYGVFFEQPKIGEFIAKYIFRLK